MAESGIILPIQCYDELGRIKPPSLLWLIVLLCAKAYFILVVSLSNFQDRSLLLSVFYPDTRDFYLNLALGIPGVMAALMVSFRETWLKLNWRFMFSLVKPMLLISLFGDLVLHIMMAMDVHWRFVWSIALSIVVVLLGIMYCLRSKRLAYFTEDWRTFEEPASEGKASTIREPGK